MNSIESLPAVNHQPEFAVHCITEAADRGWQMELYGVDDN
jgi:hypothetical protein